MMDLSFSFFLGQMAENPALLITVLLTLGVIAVNGITDAPNAIATCVSTRSMDVDWAIAMAALCNFAGVVFMTMINSTVAMTISNMVDFGSDSHTALIALCAALVSIVVWAVMAWYLGYPTSESHSLIAGLTGAAIGLQGSFSAINGHEWIKVVYAEMWTQGRPEDFSGELRFWGPRPWHSCTGLRMVRSLWGFFSWESVW